MSPAVWLLLGGTLGWIVGLSKQVCNQRDIMERMLAGAFGAFFGAMAGGSLFDPATDLDMLDQLSVSWPSLGLSITGAAALLGGLTLFRRPSTSG
jgi:uncharacterized membrane protein YeaQ/YmgE (transglycosylase-associated protein family)